MNILKAKDKVKLALTENVATRNSDRALLREVWSRELSLMGFDAQTLSAYDFLLLLKDKKIANFESIRRTRCLVQVAHKELRGTLYKERRQLADDVKHDLGYRPQQEKLF